MQNRMDPVIKADWLVALRSGEFEQARGALQVGDKFCCLGVLCKVVGIEIGGLSMNDVIVDGEDCGYRPLEKFMSRDIMCDLYNRNDGNLPESGGYGTDAYKKNSFIEIADIIEAKL